MKTINDYLYNQDKEGLVKYAVKSENFRSIAKSLLWNFKDELKEAGISIRKNSTTETLVNALLLYGLKTRSSQAEFAIEKLMNKIINREDITTVDEFIKESLKIDKQMFIDAEKISENQELNREVIEKFHFEISDIQQKEYFLNLPIEIIKKGEIISMRSGIKVLKENGYKNYAVKCDFIKEREEKKNLKDSDILQKLDDNIYLVEEDFEARFLDEEEKYLYTTINIETEEREYVYPIDILNKYRKSIN